MENPLSQESIHVPMKDSRSVQPGRSARPSQVSSTGFDYVGPPTSEGHNFFVQTPFRVFLYSMESQLSHDSIHMHMEEIR